MIVFNISEESSVESKAIRRLLNKAVEESKVKWYLVRDINLPEKEEKLEEIFGNTQNYWSRRNLYPILKGVTLSNLVEFGSI